MTKPKRAKTPETFRLAHNWAVSGRGINWVAYKLRPDTSVLSWHEFNSMEEALAFANRNIDAERSEK